MRIYVGQINPVVGDIKGNSEKIIAGIRAAKEAKAAIALFPELALTGYPLEDILLVPGFIDKVTEALKEVAKATYDIVAVVGVPRYNRFKVGKLFHNSAVVLSDGNTMGYHDKLLLPNYDIFDERRYFEPGVRPWMWEIGGGLVAITICEDIWLHSELIVHDRYTCDPIKELLQAPQRPTVLINLSASPYSIAKAPLRALVAQKVAKTLNCPVVLCNQVGSNDGVIFDGGSLAIAYDGSLLQRAKSFVEDSFIIDVRAPKEAAATIPEYDVLSELFRALVLGVRDYFHKSGLKSACIGLSGGIDSAVVACIAVAALGKNNVIGVSMPSRYSSEGSIVDAEALAINLGITLLALPIEDPFATYLKVLEPHFEGRPVDATEENLQARVRGTLLMSLANKFGHVVLNTGNKSELAMGYCTLYGDMCGGLSVIGDLTKRRVYSLARWINDQRSIIPENTLVKPPSAELREGQLDSDSLPDYEHIDTVVEEYLEYGRTSEHIAAQYSLDIGLVNSIIKRLHRFEYKRRQAPLVLRVTEKAFGCGYRFPITHKWT